MAKKVKELVVQGEVAPLDVSRGSVWEIEKGCYGYRPSSLGMCTRALVAARRGVKPEESDEVSLVKMSEGHIHEPHMVDWWLRKMGGKVTRSVECGFRVPLEDGQEAWIRGTSDGLWEDQAGRYFGWEAKALGEANAERTWEYGIGGDYEWQRDAYWAAMESTLGIEIAGYVHVIKNRNTGWCQEIYTTSPLHSKEEMVTKVQLVEEFAKLDEAEFNSLVRCSHFDPFCKYSAVHVGWGKGEREDAMEPMAQEYHELGQRIKKLEGQRKELGYQLAAGLRSRKRVFAGEFVVSTVEGQDRFNAKACLAEHPHLEQLYRFRTKGYMLVRPGSGGAGKAVEENV